MPYIKAQILLMFSLLAIASSTAQIYNSEVEAKIYLEMNNEFIKVQTAALNKTSIDKSLRYVITIFKNDPETGNNSNNQQQSSRFILKAGAKLNLAGTSLPTNDPSRAILLLLIYDENDKIVGKDRIVLNDDPENEDKDAVKLKTGVEKSAVAIASDNSNDISANTRDGVVLRGIVVEDTKTKPGRDFYKMFYSSYSLYELNSAEVVTVKELFSFGRNTQIEVYVSNEKVFQFFVNPQQDFLKKMNDAAIYYVNLHLQRQKGDSKEIQRY